MKSKTNKLLIAAVNYFLVICMAAVLLLALLWFDAGAIVAGVGAMVVYIGIVLMAMFANLSYK